MELRDFVPVPGQYAAYLFDCDGTIADSMPVHWTSWNRALGEWGGHFEESLFYGWAGMPLAETVERLNVGLGLTMPVLEVVRRKEEIYRELIPTILPIAAVAELVRVQAEKIPFAVVSGSPHESVRATLDAVGLLSYFPVIVGAEDYQRGKPHPEPFLNAAALLGVSPERCLVFEDGELGIESAKAAGMDWVRVPRLT